MKKSAYIWIFALILSVFSLFPSCGDDWETFPNYSMEGEYLFNLQETPILEEGIGDVTIVDIDCDMPGVFMHLDNGKHGCGMITNQLIYAHCDWLASYKTQPGKRLRLWISIPVLLNDGYSLPSFPLCDQPDTKVFKVIIGDKYQELN